MARVFVTQLYENNNNLFQIKNLTNFIRKFDYIFLISINSKLFFKNKFFDYILEVMKFVYILCVKSKNWIIWYFCHVRYVLLYTIESHFWFSSQTIFNDKNQCNSHFNQSNEIACEKGIKFKLIYNWYNLK